MGTDYIYNTIIRVPGHKPNKAEVNLRAQNFSRFFSAAPLLEGSVCESRAREEAERQGGGSVQLVEMEAAAAGAPPEENKVNPLAPAPASHPAHATRVSFGLPLAHLQRALALALLLAAPRSCSTTSRPASGST